MQSRKRPVLSMILSAVAAGLLAMSAYERYVAYRFDHSVSKIAQCGALALVASYYAYRVAHIAWTRFKSD
ncbi:hypothetical protein [Variovorax sp. OV329]|uniref:hypothetical protein n=1 Tax=Variovorax sp. OV329 TaxID=1882825 RepID=UPI0008ECEB54|nr:hypothetical protein [Variovorax sp. OV329]SFM98414.1 hypothetical protein SAMN05444747_112105 [Variovorax sp. OV329]